MTRQVTDQLYIEIGYLTPEEYFTYIAEAASAISGNATMNVTAGVIKSANASLDAEFSQTATISHIEGADMFAFSEAQLLAQVSRIRDNNILTSYVFDIATDYVRFRDIACAVDANFSTVASNDTIRGFDSQLSAAFSLAADVQRIPPATTAAADLTSEFSTTAVVEKITNTTISLSSTTAVSTVFDRLRDTNAAIISQSMLFVTAEKISSTNSQLSSQTDLSATISHIHGADILVNGFASLDVLADKISSLVISINSSTNLNSTATRIQETSSNHYSEFAVNSSVEAILSVSSNQTAEVDFSASVIRIQELNSNFVATFSQSSIEQRLRGFNSQLSVQSQLTATISHIEGADIRVNGFASLTASADNLPRQFSANLSTVSSVQAAGGFTFQYAAALKAYSSFTVSRYFGTGRPRDLIDNLVNYTPQFDSSIKKFGTHSLTSSSAGSASRNTSNNIGLIPQINEDFYLEIWLYPKSTTGVFTGSMSDFFSISNNNGKFRFTGRIENLTNPDGTQTYADYTHTSNFTLNTWHHLAVIKQSTYIAYYINGERVYLFGNGTQQVPIRRWGTTNNTNYNTSIAAAVNTGGNIDEWMFVKGNTYGFSTASSTIPVPTAPRTNSVDSGIEFLYHFDNNVLDDLRLVQLAAASLQTTTSVAAKLSGPVKYSANLNTTSNLTATISHIEGADMFAFTNASMSVDGTRVRFADSAQDVSSVQTVSADRTRDITSQINSAANLDLTSLRIQEGNIATESIATQLTAVVRIAGLLIDDLVESFLAADVNVVRSAESSQTVSTNVNTDYTRIRDFDIQVNSESAISVDADVRIDGIASMASEFTQTTTGDRIRGVDAGLNEFAYLTVTAYNLGKIEATLFNASILNAVISKTTDFISNQNLISTFVQANTLNSLTRTSAADLTATTNESALAVKTAGANANLVAFASELVVGVKTTSANIVCGNFATMNVDAVKTTTTSSAMDNVAVQTATAVKTVTVSSSNAIESTLEAQGIFVTSARADLTALAFELAAVAKIGDFLVSMDVAANLTANATVIRSARSNQSSIASQTALVQRIRGLTANANVVFAMSTRAGYLAQGSANIQGAMTFIAQVREIHIEEIVYVIPAEMWVYEIGSETRQYSIGSETREYIIT